MPPQALIWSCPPISKAVNWWCLSLAVCSASQLSEEVDDVMVRWRRLRQAAAEALEARPDFRRCLHHPSLPRPLRDLSHRAQLVGQCSLLLLFADRDDGLASRCVCVRACVCVCVCLHAVDALRPYVFRTFETIFLPRDAMLARYMRSSCVQTSICLSQTGVIPKRLDVGSRKQCRIAVAQSLQRVYSLEVRRDLWRRKTR